MATQSPAPSPSRSASARTLATPATPNTVAGSGAASTGESLPLNKQQAKFGDSVDRLRATTASLGALTTLRSQINQMLPAVRSVQSIITGLLVFPIVHC